ncbi:MAG: T9SS type A sorting domain-containing protein [Flavobacteriales bacterium]
MKKLNIIIILALCVLATNAQVIYTDISPDFSLLLDDSSGSTNSYPIDMDNDGINDFNFEWNWLSATLRLTYVNTNNNLIIEGFFSSPNGGGYLTILDLGDNIGPGENFSSSSPFPVVMDAFFSNFAILMTDTYAGVKFEKDGQFYYGWILLDIDDDNLIIKEYAYNSTADANIDAGEIGVQQNVLIESINLQAVSGVAEVLIGESLALEAVILPINATDMSLFWERENQTGTGTIDQNGVVYGETAGTILVNAIPNDGSGNSGQISVLVISPTYITDLEIFSVNGENQIVINNDLQLGANLLPANPSYDSLAWSVTNITGSGLIDQNGLFSGQNIGLVCIKAVTTDGTNISDSLIIEINDPITLVDSVIVRNFYNFENVSTSQTLQMIADIFPSFANDTSVTWSIEPLSGTANISESGLISPMSLGTVKVVASANDGSQATGETIITIVEYFSLQNIIVNTITGNDIVDLNDYTQMQASLIPQEIQDIEIQWSVENQDGSAFIDEDGLLSPISTGSILVIATSLDGSNMQGSKTISIENLSSIEENIKQILAYPNPVKDKIYFMENEEIEFIQVNSILGEVIYKGDYLPSIEMSGFNNGIYIVKLIYRNNQEENLMMVKNL